MDKVMIFGTGSVANELFNDLDTEKIKLLAFINSDKKVETFKGYKVIAPEDINNYQYDYIIIASGYVVKILEVLKSLNIDEKKIVSYIFDDAELYQDMSMEINKFLNAKYNRNRLDMWLKTDKNVPKIYCSTMWKSSCLYNGIYKDYVREQTVSLLAKIIHEKNVNGNVVELGVFRGDFTIVINELFFDRKLYLFDTFEGFSNKDIENDSCIDNVKGESVKFKDTSVGYVQGRLKYKDNVIFKKGYFPDTFDLYEEEFSFISIDLNLYNPVKHALEIFYDRLSKGGYILISDYYAPFYEGTKKAVDEWCNINDCYFVPIPDLYGSVLIIKE